MATVTFDFVPGDDVWIVTLLDQVLAATVRGITVHVFDLVPITTTTTTDSPFSTTTTTTTTSTTTTTVSPTTTADPLVTTTVAPESTTTTTTTQPPTTTTTIAPNPELIADVTHRIIVTYLLEVPTSSGISSLSLVSDRVFATVEEATDYVTQSLQ